MVLNWFVDSVAHNTSNEALTCLFIYKVLVEYVITLEFDWVVLAKVHR